MDGGMQEIGSVTVHMWEESWSRETGEWGSGRKEIKDDRDHLFLFVQIDFGSSGFDNTVWYVYGKKVVGGEDNTVVTEEEMERLHLPKSEYEDEGEGRTIDSYYRFGAGRNKRKHTAVQLSSTGILQPVEHLVTKAMMSTLTTTLKPT